MKSPELEDFQQIVWGYFADFGRSLPWRVVSAKPETFAYHVLVSEFMLQQTQVNRVIDKFQQWLAEYPTIGDVADASLAEVLKSWNGLGYNRRAKYLHETCRQIVRDNHGLVPSNQQELINMPGIGRNTAAAIVAYAYNEPTVFIETNIRTVFIYHFFEGRDDVSDSELIPLITAALNRNPREWYWALMDYGTYLKKQIGNVSRRSKHHVKQSTFKGSKRQIRGMVVRQLILEDSDIQSLADACQNDERLADVLNDLVLENLIIKTGVNYQLHGK